MNKQYELIESFFSKESTIERIKTGIQLILTLSNKEYFQFIKRGGNKVRRSLCCFVGSNYYLIELNMTSIILISRDVKYIKLNGVVNEQWTKHV